MDQQNESCAQCGVFPEDILMLTCNHDLCLICSARLLIKEESLSGNRNTKVSYHSRSSSILITPFSEKVLPCEICGATTVLDESSVEELKKIAKVSLPPGKNAFIKHFDCRLTASLIKKDRSNRCRISQSQQMPKIPTEIKLQSQRPWLITIRLQITWELD